MNRTCLSYWFPKLAAAGLPVPNTQLVVAPSEARNAIYRYFDGKKIGPDAEPFLEQLAAACSKIGYPCFLRTGYTSHKHGWKDTCYVTSAADILNHVLEIVDFSETADFLGLPWDTWAVRELLPTSPLLIADRYSNMPVCREFRYFVTDGKVQCFHPYWPVDAIAQGVTKPPENFGEIVAKLATMNDDEAGHVRALAIKAGEAVPGAWSIDILDTRRGWFVTDMAQADRSWHWPSCPHAEAS